MWVLECDDPEFRPRRLWLAPGTEHTVGRKRSKPTAIQEDHFIGINSKAVSRKHAILTVGTVERDSSSDPLQRHDLYIADCSKHGTSVGGRRAQNKPPTPLTKGSSHQVQLASCEYKIHLTWKPICLALTHISRTKKSYQADFAAVKNLLEPSGIKISSDFSSEYTTHLVASKRNVAATLVGLIRGDFIVTADFIEAVAKVVTPVEIAGENNTRAPLEDDFDAFWPDALYFVPPAGKEPVPRASEIYAPNTRRQTVFQGYTFVMCLQPQMDNLQGPITQGGGEAVLYNDFKVNATKPEDFVAFVKSSTGVTAPGELRNGGPGPVVVRISGDDAWTQQFVQRTDLLLGQRSILQNEFLDPILLNDASGMRQALEEEDEPSSAPVQSNGNTVPSTAPEAGGKLSARARRLKLSQVKSRFKGFDDFDTTPLSDIPMLPDVVEEDVNMQGAGGSQYHASNAVSQNGQVTPRKRGIGQAGLDEILPTAAEVKRRRVQAGIEDASQSQNAMAPPVAAVIKQKPKLFDRRIIKKGALLSQDQDSTGNVDKDLRNAVRAQAELEEQQLQAQREAELLEQPLTAEELEEIKNLVQYEDMKVRQPRAADQQIPSTEENWDDRWNGRKNFKKFRRKGQERQQQPLRANRTIIALELADENSNPLGAVRWATVSKHKRPNLKSRKSTFDNANDEEDDSQFRRRSTLAETERHLAMLEVMSDNDEEEEVNKDLGDVPSRGLLGIDDDDDDDDSGHHDTSSTHVTITQASSSAGPAKGKKRAAENSKAAPPAKRIASPRIGARAEAEDNSDSSEDDLRFKLSSRNKRR